MKVQGSGAQELEDQELEDQRNSEIDDLEIRGIGNQKLRLLKAQIRDWGI